MGFFITINILLLINNQRLYTALLWPIGVLTPMGFFITINTGGLIDIWWHILACGVISTPHRETNRLAI